MKLKPETAQALVIDYQVKFIPVMSDPERLIERTRLLLSGLAVHEIPILVTRQYPKGLGETVPEITDVLENDVTLDKITFSCLDNETIRESFLPEKPNVIVCGIETHICVVQTVLDLLEMGKTVYLVVDCLDSRRPEDSRIALKRMIDAGAIPVTAESILFELTNIAGTEKFKRISNLVTGRVKPGKSEDGKLEK